MRGAAANCSAVRCERMCCSSGADGAAGSELLEVRREQGGCAGASGRRKWRPCRLCKFRRLCVEVSTRKVCAANHSKSRAPSDGGGVAAVVGCAAHRRTAARKPSGGGRAYGGIGAVGRRWSQMEQQEKIYRVGLQLQKWRELQRAGQRRLRQRQTGDPKGTCTRNIRRSQREGIDTAKCGAWYPRRQGSAG